MSPTHEEWMSEAIAQAHAAERIGEVPIGCVIVDEPSGRIIGSGHNRRQIDSDPTAHAEILAIRNAATHRRDWRLTDCVIVVTLEPCPMCTGAIINARIPKLVFGAADPKAGAVKSLFQLGSDPRLNHQFSYADGALAAECGELLSRFFQKQRAMGKK